jgi:hypothetical protein
MAKATGVPWSREHMLMALNLYGKLSFGQFDRKNRAIRETAEKMGRTASSLAMKLNNFASLDPVQKARGIKGLSRATKKDRMIWDEFHSDLDHLGPESEELLHDLFTSDPNRDVDFLATSGVVVTEPSKPIPDYPTEASALVRVRRGQQFFRQTILRAYGIRCCISGVNVPELLVASHIKPWSTFPSERLNPRNGICLSKLHDAAFDCGLIAIDAEFRVVLSRRIRSFLPQPIIETNFLAFERTKIQPPEKTAQPDARFLKFHRETIFQN